MPDLRRIAIVLRLLHATRWTRRALNGIRRFADQAPHWQCSLHPDPLLCGFPTGHALYRAMRRETDLSPSAYRTHTRRQEAEPWHDPDTGI